MQENFDAMTTALRILTAITEDRDPDPSNVVALRDFCGSQAQGIDIDELACEVIQNALKQRSKARAKRGSE
jgi:hypothetical protein